MTDDETRRLNTALLFLELLIDSAGERETEIKDLAWAAHSYIQSVLLDGTLPDEEARKLYAKMQAVQAINEARKRLK